LGLFDPNVGKVRQHFRGASPVGENLLGKFWNFPLLGKPCQHFFGTIPNRGKPARSFLEQSPVGESLPELFWEIPQVGTLSFHLISVFSLDFFTSIEGYSGGYSQLVLSEHLASLKKHI
jgi:hypothetical protein